eukprot:CAMPEP_0194159316 /NCGR_PEP_ID=MMETSP0152-20130528/77761_1 /TAXON_ID=1049557 /ORGANISM="Thalassiothrix antarctica, Strain L6-D1" /LENGTH=997 /DNA_ID=CAMNT_0038868867 /DNA_START=53 /DNA_END=3046 /DNA_ORIENTATION=-
MNSFLVAAGACIGESQYWCALEASSCPVGTNFVSVRRLETDFKDTPAIRCLSQAGNVPLGQCTMPADNGICTGNKSNCGGCFETIEECFEPNNGACTLEATENADGSLDFAVFGICIDPANPSEGHCLWSRDECPQTDTWITPNTWLEKASDIEDFCTCEKVFVGACQYDTGFVCAVSADACEDESLYTSAKELLDMDSANCRLCDSIDLSENEFSISQQQTTQTVVSDDKKPSDNTATVESLEATENDDGSLNFAVFGACVNPADPNKGNCLWSRDECPPTDTWDPPSTMMDSASGIEDLCTCDKVIVGACRYGNDFECAVSADACEDESQYIRAKELLEMESPIDCRLCDSMDLPENAYPSTQQVQQNDNDNDNGNYQQPKNTTLTTDTPPQTQVSSFLVGAGACMTNDQYWCALEKTACPVGSKFVSARKLETDYKDKPAIQCLNEAGYVPMGQCTLPEDKDICTGHRSNCIGCFEQAGNCFEPNNGACSLEATENDDGSLNFAVFGACVNPADPNKGNCLWSRDECPPTDTWDPPSTMMDSASGIEDLCTCDKVIVGACRYGNDFECAVSADACEDESQYIRAKELLEMESPIDCRLCDRLEEFPENAYLVPQQQSGNDVSNSEDSVQQLSGSNVSNSEDSAPQLKTAAAGACVKDDEYFCALEKSQCPPESEFVSARRILTEFTDSPILDCLNNAISVSMGQCTLPSDDGLCTGHMSNCQGCFEMTDLCFEYDNDDCSLEAVVDENGDLNFAAFGLCVDPNDPKEGYCLWSRNECPSTDTWVTPSRYEKSYNIEDFCTCDKVLIGACRFGDAFVCAVSEDSCDDDSVYISAREFRDINPTSDCRLCESFTVPEDYSFVPEDYSFVPEDSTAAPEDSTAAPEDSYQQQNTPTTMPIQNTSPKPEVVNTSGSSIPKDLKSNNAQEDLSANAQTQASSLKKPSKKGIVVLCILGVMALSVLIWRVERRRRRGGFSEFSGDEYSDDQIIKSSWELM